MAFKDFNNRDSKGHLFGNGVFLHMSDESPGKSKNFQLRVLKDYFEFSFFKDAHISFYYEDDRLDMSAGPLQSHFVCNRGMNGRGVFFADSPMRSVSVYVPFCLFPEMNGMLLAGEASSVSGDIEKDRSDIFLCHVGAMTKTMNSAFNQLISCPLDSFEQKLYAQSKCMELVSLKLAQIKAESPKKTPRSLSEHDKKLASRAAKALLSDINNPPSLAELAGEIGVSLSKLKILFAGFFGIAPYEYLRKHRLDKARTLIIDGGLSASEAAYEVGYSDFSPFYRAFIKEFGFTPGDCKPGGPRSVFQTSAMI